MLYDAVADLRVDIDGYDLGRRERDTSSGFTRATTIVSLHGDGETGRGEDVTYDNDAHDVFQEQADEFQFAGTYTLAEFSAEISDLDLFFGDEPDQSAFRNYRQWAIESAALDLGLKQAGTTLAERDRRKRPTPTSNHAGVVTGECETPPGGGP